MGEWKPLFMGLIFVILISVFLGFVVVDFVDFQDIEPTGILNSTIVFIEEGIDVDFLDFNFFGFDIDILNFNFFDFFPDVVTTYLTNALLLMSLIPIWLLVPMMLLVLTGIGYTVEKMLPLT